ncbi:MAG: hypothetical protein CMA11_04035 [Euryarchaeota archaeon]|nr:hypothetical protein [Euryarchaeota archaeon]
MIVRSYWNQGDLGKAGELLAVWKNDSLDFIREKYENTTKIYSEDNEPSGPKRRVEWNPEEIISNYVQEGSRLWLKTPHVWVYWDMPADFDLEKTNHALLELAAELLLRPWIESTKRPFSTKRDFGDNYSLAFSAGTDSTAAMLLMPGNTILAYHQRDYDSMIDHRNALKLIDHIKTYRDVFVIKSNHEKIRKAYGNPNGFSTDYASGAHLVLMADYLNLKGVSFGLVIENGWLKKASKFRDFADSNHWKYWSKRFNEAGLHLVFPTNMISEAGCMKICHSNEIGQHLNSCMRGDGQVGCGKCWKCFHKNGPLGRKIDVSSHEISTYLQKRPLRTAMHALWAIKKMHLEHLVPDLEIQLQQDFSWWEDYYAPGLEILPPDLREIIQNNLELYLQQLEDSSHLTSIDLFSE